jgi:decaprenylphospho-beta-D-ribofuranose 2-oxidase
MKRVFTSLDRRTVYECEFDEPDRYRELLSLTATKPLIGRGAGISYVAASFGAGATSIGMQRFNRILAFNKAERWIEVEAGITLGRLYEFLTGHGLCLPVQPGHPQITVGGCIAGNIHGKNQFREGLFGDHVHGLRLFHPSRGLLDLSSEHNSELFELTVGGFGLTGIIVSARLSLAPLPSTAMLVSHIPVGDLVEAFARLADLKASHDMVYAWLDLADRSRPGRGYIVAAAADPDRTPAPAAVAARELVPGGSRFPRLFSNFTLPAINQVYRTLGTRQRGPRRVPLDAILYPAVGKERYFDAFGKTGFIELQVMVPENAAAAFIPRVLALVRKHGCAIALTTLKSFRGKPSLLHYTGTGFSFTIDIGNDASARHMLDEFDEINCELGATTAIMKDSRLSASVARRQYAGYDTFKQRLLAFDPTRLFRSDLSRRLELQAP